MFSLLCFHDNFPRLTDVTYGHSEQKSFFIALIPTGTFTRTLCTSLLQLLVSTEFGWETTSISLPPCPDLDWLLAADREKEVTSWHDKPKAAWIPRSYLAVACRDQERYVEGDGGAYEFSTENGHACARTFKWNEKADGWWPLRQEYGLRVLQKTMRKSLEPKERGSNRSLENVA